MSILVVSGPSGAGKSTLIKKLLSEDKAIYFSISHTTRKPRINEKEGINYYFISKEEFEDGIKKGQFIEWAKVHESYYGSSLVPIKRALEEGKLVLFDVDVQGFLLIRKHFPSMASVFITTKNKKDLENRLKTRADTSDEDIQIRLNNALGEMSLIKEYDYLIINDKLDKSYEDFKAVIRCTRQKTSKLDLEILKTNWNKGE